MRIDGHTNNGGTQCTLSQRDRSMLYEALIYMREIYEEDPYRSEFTIDEIRELEEQMKP